MKPTLPPLDAVTALPLLLRVTVPADYQDINQHMNIRHYLSIFDDAGWALYERLGLLPDALLPRGLSTFDLEHHVHYLNEVLVGDTAAVYGRMVARSAKRIHYLMLMVNETRGSLSAIFECVNTFVDLTTRRTTPYPPDIAERMDELIAAHQALTWDAPVCGVMSA